MIAWNGTGITYRQEKTAHIAYPIGGLGAGMFCVEGSGMLSRFSLRHAPNLQKEPGIYAAVTVRRDAGNTVKILEGPITNEKLYRDQVEFSLGCSGSNYGLPRFANNTFTAAFPFCRVDLSDEGFPLRASLEAWSPFLPKNADQSSLPAGSLTYTLENTDTQPLEGVFYFCAPNFLSPASDHGTPQEVKDAIAKPQTFSAENGFVFYQPACGRERFADAGWFRVTADEPAFVDCDWFRGGWFDSQTMQWNRVMKGIAETKTENPDRESPGASLAVPFRLSPGETKAIRLYIAWYVPCSALRLGPQTPLTDAEKWDIRSYRKRFYRPWYAAAFASVDDVTDYFRKHYERLRSETAAFTHKLFAACVPEVIKDSVSANLCILKSPTVLRQTDGRLWGWEGCQVYQGSCHGTCTHVWNYAQAVCKLFPDLERGLRETEFLISQDETGHQNFRASLPIRAASHDYFAASDGQLGGLIKLYREWKISGCDEWLASLWPAAKKSLAYCIETWDPAGQGLLTEPHHNTYDIEFWGADIMCTSFYLGALKAAAVIAEHFGETENASQWLKLYEKGRAYCETELFNGEFFVQKVQWTGLRAKFGFADEPPQAEELLRTEGPKYQYGNGCISDGVLGAWLAKLAGLGDILDAEKVTSHLLSVYKYNLKHSLTEHSNPQRPGYAVGAEGGLLLCTWPNGGKPSLPFVYSDEVWTGIEHQVASHLMLMGHMAEGLEIERICRGRYDGGRRNPFSEVECGLWYARAMASYALLESLGADIVL